MPTKVLQNILQTEVRCIRPSLLENFTVTLFDVHVPLYYTLKKLRHSTTSEGKTKQVHNLFYIPKYHLPTEALDLFKLDTGIDHARTSALTKSCLNHPGKVPIDLALN